MNTPYASIDSLIEVQSAGGKGGKGAFGGMTFVAAVPTPPHNMNAPNSTDLFYIINMRGHK